jgi:hypothetical protein
MKTKTYKFEVTIEERETSSGLLQSLKDEIADEKKQKDLTVAINKESQKAHLTMLKDFVRGLMDEFSEVMLFIGYQTTKYHTNGYHKNSVTLRFINGRIIELVAEPIVSKLDETKYTTYASGVRFAYHEGNGYTTYYEDVASFFKKHKDTIKACLIIKNK